MPLSGSPPTSSGGMIYRIKNFDKFQHYRQRDPPWIKLHYSLLSSADWVLFDDPSRVLAIACLLVASKTKGIIDGSPAGLDYLKRVAYLHKAPSLKPLIISGFLVAASIPCSDASIQTPIASTSNLNILSLSDSSLSVEGGVGETERPSRKGGKIPRGEFMNVLLSESEFLKLGERFGNTLARRIENLSQYLASKGDKYKSHYATLLQWAAREKEGTNGKQGIHSQSPLQRGRGLPDEGSSDNPKPPGKYAHLGTVLDVGGED